MMLKFDGISKIEDHSTSTGKIIDVPHIPGCLFADVTMIVASEVENRK